MAKIRIKDHPLYSSWTNMKTRCNNPKSTNYHSWGGRGISYDSAWESFKGFCKDMEASHKRGLTLDRINNDGNYCKENCRWVSLKEQNNNRSNNHRFEYKGISKTLTNWATIIGVKRSTLAQRVYVYKWDIEKVLSTSVKEVKIG